MKASTIPDLEAVLASDTTVNASPNYVPENVPCLLINDDLISGQVSWFFVSVGKDSVSSVQLRRLMINATSRLGFSLQAKTNLLRDRDSTHRYSFTLHLIKRNMFQKHIVRISIYMC